MTDKRFYLQDKRKTVGNSIAFWALGGLGYTCDVRCAQVMTEEEALTRETNSPEKFKKWPVETINRLIQFQVDHHDLDHDSLVPYALCRLDERFKP